jgi:16S rRNA (cytidine1402-2'-O)-methyltransferase
MATLYIIGTPIGNLKDITLRALETLQAVDVIACEDTRHTLGMLNALEIRKKLISCRSHNEAQGAAQVVRLLEEDQDVAYVSDAGTPGLSDPGAVVVRMVREAGFPVVPIPGPSAFGTLQSVSSFGDKSVTFDGFLSPKPGRRRKRLKELLEREEGFILYESPFRIVKLLKDIADLESDREVLVGREMTKVYEEFLEGPAGRIAEDLEGRTKVLGEFSVLVRGRKKG